ncbi:putative Phenylalanine--tRNA ligase beta subunit [Cocos nucifera]|uniref:Putative Phenylalanine--tRNA ligase beta subunit n=1 Tax=Cocos nucifera TaxID=13894 RepID=A0A8K0IQN9_COCNU|nr:putative Phenylalanine--tRNA ligase beta subunit [Cocos nucifera]
MAQNGADFHLPDEILSVIPTDPYEQLDIARKITSMAIASRVTRLEDEARRLRQKISERDRLISELQDKLNHLDRKVRDSDASLRAAVEENAKLSKERDMLALTSKKLGRELAKV